MGCNKPTAVCTAEPVEVERDHEGGTRLHGVAAMGPKGGASLLGVDVQTDVDGGAKRIPGEAARV